MAEIETSPGLLPKWLRKAFDIKSEKKQEKIFTKARHMGFSAEEILVGYHEHKLKGKGLPSPHWSLGREDHRVLRSSSNRNPLCVASHRARSTCRFA